MKKSRTIFYSSEVQSILCDVALKYSEDVEKFTATGPLTRRQRFARDEVCYRVFAHNDRGGLWPGLDFSLPDIAALVGYSDHTGVMAALKRAATRNGKPVARVSDLRDGGLLKKMDFELFGFLVAAWRDKHDLTDTQAANRVGMDRITIARARGGESVETWVFLRLCQAMEENPLRFLIPHVARPVSRETPVKHPKNVTEERARP